MSPAFKSLLCLAALGGAGLVLSGSAPAAKPKPKPGTTTTKTSRTSTTSTTTSKQTTTAPMGATDKRCWNDLIRDWYDGRIDSTYPVHCYQDALKHLPADVKTYSDAYDVISRALADATRGKKHVNPNAPVAPPSGQGKKGSPGGGPGAGGGPGGGGGPSAGGGPIGGGLNRGDRGADGIPVPLLILGGLALLLVAAGGVGLALRQIQNRRGGPRPS